MSSRLKIRQTNPSKTNQQLSFPLPRILILIRLWQWMKMTKTKRSKKSSLNSRSTKLRKIRTMRLSFRQWAIMIWVWLKKKKNQIWLKKIKIKAVPTTDQKQRRITQKRKPIQSSKLQVKTKTILWTRIRAKSKIQTLLRKTVAI